MRNLFLLALLVACGDKDSDDTASTGGDTGGGTTGPTGNFEDFINVTDEPDGDLSCFTGSLGTESAASGCVESKTMSGNVIDFQTDNPVDEAKLELFLADGIFGAPDHTLTSDPNGLVSVGMNTCEPFTYRVSSDPLLDETKVTIESHDVMPWGPVATISHEMNSVSSTTYALIPSLLGVAPDVSKGIVAGSLYDCDGDPVEGGQVVIKDSAGNIPADVLVRYFVDDFPNRNQPHTSEDGLWILMDVPVGQWTVEAYVADGTGGHTNIAQTSLDVYADSINISSVHVGISDGIKMPPSCLEGCSPS